MRVHQGLYPHKALAPKSPEATFGCNVISHYSHDHPLGCQRVHHEGRDVLTVERQRRRLESGLFQDKVLFLVPTWRCTNICNSSPLS